MTTPTTLPDGRPLTGGQQTVLGITTTAIIGIGGVGAAGTYTNIHSVMPHSATALGAVAAGEGATLILALVYVGLTMLGQSSPAAVRLGLWLLPAMASGMSAYIAPSSTKHIVYGATPLAMCVAAEGAGLLARRIVIRTTGVDMETRRRNAATVQRLAYERARAVNHPGKWTKLRAERRAWRLARHVGVGDTDLGANLVTVQRTRVTAGADAALAAMFTAGAEAPALPAAVEPVTTPVAQASAPESDHAPLPDTPPVTALHNPETGVTLEQLAAVAGVPTPATGEFLTDEQLDVVLRSLRYRSDPPVSYRQAVAAFRDAGFVGGEARVRKAWGLLVSNEETDGDPEAAPVR